MSYWERENIIRGQSFLNDPQVTAQESDDFPCNECGAPVTKLQNGDVPYYCEECSKIFGDFTRL